MKMDLALNNLQRFICHKTQTNNWYRIKNVYKKDYTKDVNINVQWMGFPNLDLK